MPRANSPRVAIAKMAVPIVLMPTTSVRTAIAILIETWLLVGKGLWANVSAIEDVKKYSAVAIAPAIADPVKQRSGVGGTYPLVLVGCVVSGVGIGSAIVSTIDHAMFLSYDPLLMLL